MFTERRQILVETNLTKIALLQILLKILFSVQTFSSNAV